MSAAIRARYGQWLLVKLTTGRWSALWWAFAEDAEVFQAILDEDQEWFDGQIGYMRPEVQGTKLLALQVIQTEMEQQSKASPENREHFQKHLQRVRAAIARTNREADQADEDQTTLRDSTETKAANKIDAAMTIAGFNPETIDLPLLVGALVTIKRWAESELHLAALDEQSLCNGMREEGKRLLDSHQGGKKLSKEVS